MVQHRIEQRRQLREALHGQNVVVLVGVEQSAGDLDQGQVAGIGLWIVEDRPAEIIDMELDLDRCAEDPADPRG